MNDSTKNATSKLVVRDDIGKSIFKSQNDEKDSPLSAIAKGISDWTELVRFMGIADFKKISAAQLSFRCQHCKSDFPIQLHLQHQNFPTWFCKCHAEKLLGDDFVSLFSCLTGKSHKEISKLIFEFKRKAKEREAKANRPPAEKPPIVGLYTMNN